MHLNSQQLSTLHEAMTSYLSGHKSRSVATLARRAGVGQSTVRRLLNGTAVNPDFETLIAVLKVIFTADEAMAFIKTIDPELSKHIEAIYGGLPAAEPTDRRLNRLLEDENSYVIFQLASMEPGTNRESLIRILGEKAETDLDYMIDQGIVSESNGVISARVKDFAISDVHTALKTVRHLIRRFDTSLGGTSASALSTLVGAVSEQGLIDIHDEIERSTRVIDSIRQRNPGKLPVYVNILMNLLDSDAFHREPRAGATDARAAAQGAAAQGAAAGAQGAADASPGEQAPSREDSLV